MGYPMSPENRTGFNARGHLSLSLSPKKGIKLKKKSLPVLSGWNENSNAVVSLVWFCGQMEKGV